MTQPQYKLVHVSTIPDSLFYFLDGQVRYLKKKGFEVHGVSSPGGLLDQFGEREGAKIHGIEMTRYFSPLRDFIAVLRLFKLFRKVKPHIVHSHTPKGGLLGMMAAFLARVPVRIYHVHGLPYMTATGIKRSLLVAIEWFACRLSHRVLCVSPSIRRVLIENHICNSEKCKNLNPGGINGVDAVKRFNPAQMDRTIARSAIGIPVNARVIGFVGRLVRDKGIIELMTTWESLRVQFEDLYLLVMGNIEERDAIPLELRDRLRSDPRIRYVGQVQNPEDYYAAMDIFALPSYREGYGQVAIEASAMSLPVVATRIPGLIDSVSDGETGTLVLPRNADALEKALKVYLKNRHLRTLHGRNGRKRALAEFCPEDIWKKKHQEYLDLLETHLKPHYREVPKKIGTLVKFLFVTRIPGTAVFFIFPLAKRLREMGNLVEFAFGPGIGLKEVQDSGFPFTLLSMESKSSSLQNTRVVGELRKVIKRGQFDVVHTYTPVVGIYGRIAAWRANVPVVVHSVLGSLVASGVPLMHRLMYVASELTTSQMVDLFITLNDADRQAMVKYRLASANKVVSLKYEYGVDLREFNPDLIDKTQLEELRKKYRIETGTSVIGFVGRMIGAKGILDLFEAYQIIHTSGFRAKLLYVGEVLTSDKDNKSFEQLKKSVIQAHLEDNVIFAGYQKDVPTFMSMMDVVVLPSYHEGFPRIPVEAGAMRKPSICTAVSGAEVAIKEGETGFIVPIKDPKHLAEAIHKILSSPALACEMGRKARERIEDHFDENKIVDQQVRIYQDFFRKKKLNLSV